ncbi:MAG: hypothetical protein K8S21_00990 [Gemmatimonadetes bacterium]|nr:hypothetical protein [Gemmatimonadota bacterium]
MLLLLASGCDQDPFGRSETHLVGRYRLLQFESGDYYVIDAEHRDGGGALEGTIVQLGWSDTLLVAERRSLFGGASEWVLADPRSGQVRGPYSRADIERFPDVRAIPISQADSVWARR